MLVILSLKDKLSGAAAVLIAFAAVGAMLNMILYGDGVFDVSVVL